MNFTLLKEPRVLLAQEPVDSSHRYGQESLQLINEQEKESPTGLWTYFQPVWTQN